MNQMITPHKAIYNLLGSGVYHKPRYILKSKLYEFHNRKIGLFSGNDTSMSGYFLGMHIECALEKHLSPHFLLRNSTI